MSDLFYIPEQNEDEWKKKKAAYDQNKSQINEQNDYWQKRIENVKQEQQKKVDNYNRYGVDVPDEYYEQFNKIISQAETPEQAQDEAYRIGSAVKYSQMYDIPLDEAYGKVDALNEALFTDLQDQKGRFEAVCDMFTLGTNTVKLGRLGQQLMQADRLNDTELSDSLKAQIDAINQQNVLLQDKTPRHWVMEALKAGAQSLPFTGAAAGAGLIGNFILPDIGGTAGAFLASSYLSAGQEYLDMLANGASPQTARTVAMVSGGIQGLIEADLGITKGIVKGAGKMIGKEAAERAAKKGLAEIGQKVFKRFHFGAGKKLLANYLAEYGKNVLGEGVEEFMQEITSIVGQEVAASLDGYDIPDDDMKSIVKQTSEAFKNGILGALALGFVPAGLNAGAEVKDYRLIKKAAENIESPEMFYEQVKDNPVFGEMKEASKKDVSRQIWEAAQQRKEESVEQEARNIAETRDAAEGAEENIVTEEGEEIVQNIHRTESGKLDIQDDEHQNDDGTISGTFRAGDSTKKESNRYGYITYTADEKNKTVTVDAFKMTKGREGLRGELFDEFAQKYSDYDIQWNPIQKDSRAIKEQLIENNPSGAANGLNYYTAGDLDDIQTRKQVASELRKNIHNIETDGNGNFKRTELTNKQVAAGITLIESAAKRMNMSLADYVSKTFGNQIFGNREDFTQRTLAQGEQIENKAGGMSQGVAQANWREVGQQVKAVIYAGENADFSTWAHEMAHVFQNQLDGDLKTEAESAFNVNNGDWINSTYTFKDGRTMSSAEAFAYGFQDWLETGKVENKQMQNIFEKFAQFIADAYNRLRNHLTFTPEIESVFNKLLDGDDTIMSKALKAAQAEENEYRAKLKRDAEEKQVREQAEKEEAKKQAQAQRKEESEYTDFEEETEDQSPEELEKKLDEATNENKEETNAIDDALENLPLADEKKAEIAEVLKDDNSTQIDKAKAVTEAAASVYAEDSELPDMMFQAMKNESGKPLLFQTTDLTQEFADISSGKITDQDIANHIMSIIGQTFDTATRPLKIKLVNGNKAHVLGSNVKLNPNQKKKHNATLSKIESIINNASMIGKSEPVDLSHNTNKRTLKHKQNVLKYITFESPIKINNDYYTVELITERVKGQAADLLNLYNVRVRKNTPANTLSNPNGLNALSQGQVNNITTGGNVNTGVLLYQEVRDNEYEEAVKNGDTEKAMQMLQEEADRKGYNLSSDYQGTSAFNGAAPYRNGYYSTKEERLQAIKDEEFEDTETLGDFAYDKADALGFDYLINDPRAYRFADDKRKEAIDNLRKAVSEARSGKKNVKIKMYRSVPINIKENLFRNGDWITPSKSYAEDNADVHGWEKAESRIIEQEVDLEHIWWDGNDIAEWGYDDEKEAVYKNTENNRKLFEITYDDDGNLIPLSKRFDESNPSILFQIAGEIGAQNLDDSEVQEGVSRMQNLAIAKQMDAEGKDAKKIRLLTGWEKGADGKWRWEIDDGEFTRPQEGTKWETKDGKTTQVPKLQREGYLREFYKNPELYKAYSDLEYVWISFKDFPEGESGSTYTYNGNIHIEINENDSVEEQKKTLVHEIQHIIQHVEGFAKGGSMELAAKYIDEQNNSKKEIQDKALAWSWKKELEEEEKKHPELRGQTYLMDALIDEYKEDGYDLVRLEKEGWIPSRDVRYKGFNLYVRGYDKEGFEDAYNEWSNGKLSDYKPKTNNQMAQYLTYRHFGGEVESRNVEKRKDFTQNQRRLYLLAATEDVARDDQIMLFQKVYHGSGADFDKFDTEHYGLSGEGSMSFGYGTYLTDNEEIARDYAQRQVDNHAQKIRNAIIDVKSKLSGELSERAKYSYEKELEELEEQLRIAESVTPAVKIALEVLKANNFNAEEAKKDFANDTDPTYKLVYEYLNKYSYEELESMAGRNLYTVEIPDNGYIVWDKSVRKQTADKIKRALFNEITTNPDSAYYNYYSKTDLMKELDSVFSYVEGQQLYRNVSAYLEGDEKASKFLEKIGYVGIKYPAGTIHGNGNGAYNYVIFNDEDAKIVEHLLFQTNAELMEEAQGFDSWQEFMDYCETFHEDDEVSPIPSAADAQWYQSFWETSHGLQTEQEKNEQAVKEKAEKDGTVPLALDAYFASSIKSHPELLEDFLHEAARIDAIDLNDDEWQRMEGEEDAKVREEIAQLKDFIHITLSDYNWATAIKRVQGGGEITEGMRKRLISEMTDGNKTRDFRALYAELLGDEQYAVDEEDSIAAELARKLKKNQKRYYGIVAPNEDIARVSPERRKRIAEEMANRDIAAKIRSGSLKLDDELDTYIKSLNSQIKDIQKQFDELQAETKADYQRMADAEKRKLLKLNEELLIARTKLKTKNAEIESKIKKGLKITDKYKKNSQNLNANYDEIFRKFTDLKNSMQITAEVQAALERQEQLAGIKENLNEKQREKNLTAEVKKMRIQLVKRTMRRVPFNRIDYNNAKTVIAIQRMLEPNLIGGVNRFIGVDSVFLRGVISQLVTDKEYKEKILHYLSKNSRSSQAFADFKKKVEEIKSIKDFDSWTAKDRKNAIKYLPKENWVRELNLEQLAKEREESIDLDVGMKEVEKPVYDEKTGEIKTYKDADGNEHNVTTTAYRLEYSDEIGQMVKDAVGADMFDRIINQPFAEWTTEQLEQLAQRIDELYTEGRDLYQAKQEVRKKEAERIRKLVEDAIKENGLNINDDDTPEEKARKQKKISKMLGMDEYGLKGTEAGKSKGFAAKITRLLHSYSDMNVLRFARMLDGQSEGENVRMLYRREDDCYNAKARKMDERGRTIKKIMADNKITEADLAKTVRVEFLNTEFTIDELLYFLAADKDYAEDEVKLSKGLRGIEANDDYAATSRNAVMFGNMMSDDRSQELKERYSQMDKEMEEAIKNGTLDAEQMQAIQTGLASKKPGTSAYIADCHDRWEATIRQAERFLEENPKYKALMEAIEADYAEQYERMNEVSINEFNMPVHRVKAYVPLVRRESNGDTNANQVREDLIGAYGGENSKQWVNKGMTQRRVNISPLNQKPVQTGLFRTWADSIERTEHFIAYAPYVRQLNEVYKSRDAAYTRRFMEARYGKDAVRYLDEYINEVANPNAGKIREKGAEWLHTLRGKTAPAYLGWKFSAVVKQGLTSPWPYMQFVNPAEYMASAMECWTRKDTYEAIKAKSAFMNNRVMDPINDLVDEMADQAKTKFDRGWSNFTKKGMAGLEWIDWTCVAPGWLACYKKEYNRQQKISNARYEAKIEELKERNAYADIGTSEYLSPEQMQAQAKKEIMEDIELEAIRYADDCTRQCQPSSRVTDLAPLFKNSSEAMKAFLQFQTSLNVIWQNIRYDMPYAVKQKQFNRIVGTVMGYVLAGIFMNSVMDGIFSGADDDDDRKALQALRNLIYYSTTQFTDAIPMIGGDITNMTDQLITGKRGFYSSGTDMTPSASKLMAAMNKVRKGDWKKAATLTAEGIGLFMGAPVSGVKEINKLLGKPLDNGDVNLLRGLSDVYGIADDIIQE